MISVIVPVLNEAGNIKSLVPKVFKTLGENTEVLLVDGHSTDGTYALVRELAKAHKKLKIIQQPGKGFADALIFGLKKASGDVVITMDAENHMPSEIPLLIDELQSKRLDAVVGSRFLKGSSVKLQKKRFIQTRIANKIARAAMNLNVKDCSSGFRAYRAKTVKKILDDIETEYFSVQVELLERISGVGGRLGEIPVHYLRRERGESKFNLTYAIKDATKLLKKRVRRKRPK